MKATPIRVEIAPGELIDKITILEIKSARITEAAAKANVQHELALLRAVRDRSVRASARLDRETDELRAVNLRLWDIEDEIRRCEQRQDFGRDFVELARSVYRENDLRARIKRRINELLGSSIVEEKLYVSPDAD